MPFSKATSSSAINLIQSRIFDYSEIKVEPIRLDKWLWAARFFKTRSLAQQMIEGGKVTCEGQRVKPSKRVQTGMILHIRIGEDVREVEILALASKRQSAPIAQTLYKESEASLAERAERAAKRKVARLTRETHQRPNKKERRTQERFKQQQHNDSKW